MDESCKQSKIGRILMWSEWLDSLFNNHFQKPENTCCFVCSFHFDFQKGIKVKEKAWILGKFITRTC